MNDYSLHSMPKTQVARFRKAALRYGFSPDAFMRRIIDDATQALLAIPEESLSEYENPEEITSALRDSLRDEQEGTMVRTLPRPLVRARR